MTRADAMGTPPPTHAQEKCGGYIDNDLRLSNETSL